MAEIGGEIYFDNGYHYFKCFAEETEIDAQNNRSKIHYGVNFHITGGHWAGNNIVIYVNGIEKQIGYGYYGVGTYTLFEQTEWFTHNSTGGGTFHVEFWFQSSNGSKGGGADYYVTLINRYPKLNSGSNFTDSTNPVYNITAYGGYPLRVKLEAGGDTQLITRDLTSRNSQVYTLELTQAERKTLRDLSPDGQTLDVIETVCAMSGNTELSYDYKPYKMTINRRKAKLRINGAYRDAYPYVRINGVWKEAKPYVRINNEWKEVV